MGSYQVVLRELKRQKSSKPSRDLSQSVCQMRMKSAYAEATQCSYFNVIQFALTAADTKWVIILHCSFLNEACVNYIQNNILDQEPGSECESQADSIFNNSYALNYSTSSIQSPSCFCFPARNQTKLNLIQYFIILQ